jgi:hypothetical protein
MSQSQQAICTNRMLRLAFDRMVERVCEALSEQMKEDFFSVLEDIESQLQAEDDTMNALLEITDESFEAGVQYMNESLAPADKLEFHDYEDEIDTILEIGAEIPASTIGIDLDNEIDGDNMPRNHVPSDRRVDELDDHYYL